MADPFALINRTLDRNKGVAARAAAKAGYATAGGITGPRRRKIVDPSNPADAEYLRRMHPDFDEVMVSASIDYRTRCHTDAGFASKFGIPPVVDALKTFAEHSNSVDAVCWGPSPNSFLSASHDGTLKVWDAKSGRCTDTMTGHGGGIFHCAVSRDGKHIISCGSGESRSVLLWKWDTKKVCGDYSDHRKPVVHAAFSGDGAAVVTCDQEGTVSVHDLASGKRTMHRSMHCGVAHGGTFCAEDPFLLCTVGADGFLHVTDLREAAKQQTWMLPSAAANCVVYSRSLSVRAAHDGYEAKAVEFVDSRTAYSVGADHKLKRWDMRTVPKCETEYLGHTSPIRALAVAPDQKFLVTGCEDGSCRLWAKEPLDSVRGHLTQLRAELKELELRLQEPRASPAEVGEMNRKKLAVKEAISAARSSEEQMVRNGYSTAARTLHGHHGIISGCAWRRDDVDKASILSSSWDQTVRLFTINLSDCA